MADLSDNFSNSSGIPFRLFFSTASKNHFWAFLVDKDATVFIPILMLSFHRGVLEGYLSGVLTKEDCGIYTSMMHTWMAFGMTPELIYVPMEEQKEIIDLFPLARPYIQFRQKNEIGTVLGRVSFSLADSIVFSEILNAPIVFSKEAVNQMGIKFISSYSSPQEQILKMIDDYEANFPPPDTKG